jgi:hypothetical protein
MRCAGMMGCESTALEVGKLILALDPCHDIMGVLLHLDFYALQARKYDAMLSLAKLNFQVLPTRQKGQEEEESMGGGGEHVPASSESSGDSDGGEAACATTTNPPAPSSLCLADLPNLKFSAALAMFEASKQLTQQLKPQPGLTKSRGVEGGAASVDDTSEKEGGTAAATDALCDALSRFPAFLAPLLAVCDGAGSSSGHSMLTDWPALQKCEPFAELRRRQGRLVDHLAAAYACRCGSLWKRDDTKAWLFAAATRVADDTATSNSEGPSIRALLAETERLFRSLKSSSCPAVKYLDIPLAELGDQYEQLPPDLNVLDPTLLAPHRQRRLAEDARRQRRLQHQAMQQQARGGGGGARGGGPRNNGDDELSPEEMAFVQGLDPSAPLLQLFWQSALPWNQVDATGGGGGGGGGDGDVAVGGGGDGAAGGDAHLFEPAETNTPGPPQGR